MIIGNSTWEAALAAAQKKPLYFLVIDDLNFYVTTFVLADNNVVTTGAGYGTAYGTAYGDY